MNTTFKRWKPIEIMLAVLFLVAPFYYHPNIGGEGLRIPNNITVWMMATIIISYSLHLVLQRPTFVIPKYFLYIAAFPILITLSGFVTGVEQPLTWLFRLLFIWGGLAFFFSLFQHGLKQGRLDRILFVIVISALLQGLVGTAQIWLQADMPFWLPDVSKPLSGFFQQLNNQVTYQVTAIIIAIYLATRPYVVHGKRWKQALVIITVLMAGFLVFASSSRIGVLALILSLLFILPALCQRLLCNKKLSLTIFAALIIGIGIGLIDGGSKISDKISDKTIIIQPDDYSSSARLGIYSISLDLIKLRPIFGHGIGSFGSAWQYAKPGFYQTHADTALPSTYVSHPHNEIIFWIVEGGALAGLGLISILIGSYFVLIKVELRRRCVYIALLLPLALHTQVELPFYTSSIHWFLFIIILFIMNRHGLIDKRKTLSKSMNFLFQSGNVVLALIGTSFLIHSMLSNLDFLKAKEASADALYKYAKQSPYFSSELERINMAKLLYRSMESSNYSNIQYVATWAENYALNNPDEYSYFLRLDAYESLRSPDDFCRVATGAVSIYPRDPTLQKAKKRCTK